MKFELKNETNDLGKHCKILEYDVILKILADCSIFDESRDRALKIRPDYHYDNAVKHINLTVKMYEFIMKYGYPGVENMKNCMPALNEARLGSSLTLRELLEILKILKNMRALHLWSKNDQVDNEALKSLFDRLYVNRQIEDRLNQCILSDEMLEDNASPLLYDIRKKSGKPA